MPLCRPLKSPNADILFNNSPQLHSTPRKYSAKREAEPLPQLLFDFLLKAIEHGLQMLRGDFLGHFQSLRPFAK